MAIKVGFELSEEDYELYKEIKNVTLRQHNKLRGVLGHEVVTLAHDSQEFREKKEKFPRDEPKIKKRTREMLKNIFDKLPNSGLFPEKLLNRLIETHAGSSEPTKRNYKNILLGHCMVFNARRQDKQTMLFEKGRLPPWLKE